MVKPSLRSQEGLRPPEGPYSGPIGTSNDEGNYELYRVIDVIGTSTTSCEEAAADAINTAGQSVRDLRGAEVVKQDIHVRDGGELVYRTKIQPSSTSRNRTFTCFGAGSRARRRNSQRPPRNQPSRTTARIQRRAEDVGRPAVSSTRSTAMSGGAYGCSSSRLRVAVVYSGPTASKTRAPLTGRLEYETV
jgi:dodecin